MNQRRFKLEKNSFDADDADKNRISRIFIANSPVFIHLRGEVATAHCTMKNLRLSASSASKKGFLE